MGNWVEDESGGTSSSAPPVMSVHYADQRCLASGHVKARVLEQFFFVLEQFPGAASVLRGGTCLLPAGAVTWAQVTEVHRLQFGQGKVSKKDPKDKKDKKDKNRKDKTRKDTKERRRTARTAAPVGSGPGAKRSRSSA